MQLTFLTVQLVQSLNSRNQYLHGMARERSYIPLAALSANMSLFSGVDDKMQSQLLLALEGFHADSTDKRPVGVVTLLVSSQVVFTLQTGTTDVTEEPSDRQKYC